MSNYVASEKINFFVYVQDVNGYGYEFEVEAYTESEVITAVTNYKEDYGINAEIDTIEVNEIEVEE